MAKMLEPLRIRSMELHNRLVMPPMATRKAESDGRINQSVLDYYDEKSAGGTIGLVITEHQYISIQGKASANQISVEDDSAVENLKKLAGIIHQNGSKGVVQISHAGSTALREFTQVSPVAPSSVANPRVENELPHALTVQEIAQIVSDFASAAARVKSAGFDGVEIHSAHGYLLSQFFSPLTNLRNDEYGGSVQNRIRIHLEIVSAVRKAVGEDFPIFLRLGASDYMEGGITPEQSVLAARALEDAGVDVLDISGGFCMYTIPSMANPPQGYFAPLSEAIKRELRIPVILTGGVNDILAAEQLLLDQKADLIGVGRAIRNDSGWAAKAVETLRQ